MSHPKEGDLVYVRSNVFDESDNLEMLAEVVDVLAMQFIAEWQIHTQMGESRVTVFRRGFFLYTGKGDTWKEFN